MVDFDKYLKEAKKDPEFREELLHGDANRAIKARFGDDLAYKVECEEEITFKIKTSDSDFESVAGGVPKGGLLGRSMIQFDPAPNGQAFFPRDSDVGTYTTYENGKTVQHQVMKTGDGMVKFVKKPHLGAIPNDDLDGVVGGYGIGADGMPLNMQGFVPFDPGKFDLGVPMKIPSNSYSFGGDCINTGYVIDRDGTYYDLWRHRDFNPGKVYIKKRSK